jgi:hypothetical protein
MQLVEKRCGINYCVCKTHTAFPLIQFSERDISIHASLFFIFFGKGFEVLKVMRIHNVVWVCFHSQSEDGGSMS